MSSAETLNFGPQWLRELSSGGSSSTTPSSPSAAAPTTKYKLAQHRYGREEMLALFEQRQSIPPELTTIPTIISEESLQPISLIPLTEEDQRAFSGVINSDIYHRQRGGANSMGRGRSVPPRGRGRGRGDSYMRSVSQNEEGGPPYGRGGPREYGRRESWDDRGFGRGRGFDEGAPTRKPIRRSDACDDWRSDTIRGSGDGADAEGENTDWKPAPRRDSWRDAPPRSGSNWREAGGGRERDRDWTEVPFHSRDRKAVSRARSLSNKYDGDLGLMPEWANDAEGEEVGVFDSSGTFQSKQLKSIRATKEKEKPTRPLNSQTTSLQQITEVKSPTKDNKDTDTKSPPKAKENEPVDQTQRPSPAAPTDAVTQEVTENTENKAGKPAPPPGTSTENKQESLNENIDVKNLLQTLPNPTVETPPVNKVEEAVDLSHIEQAALNLVDSITENDEEGAWDPPADPNPGFPSTSNIVELSQNWFYKDPQGETQGPFTNQEMKEWFSAGYFTVNLQIKRACDPKFITLGELLSLRGPRPFSLTPPPDLAAQKHEILEQQLKLLALQKQQQQQIQLQKQQQQQQQILQQQQLMRYQQQQQEAAYRSLMSQLNTSDEFLAMNAQQKQATVLQYMNIIQKQATTMPQNKPPMTNPSQHTIWDSEMATVRRPSPVPTSQHIADIIKQKEQQNEIQKLQEEQERRKEEQLRREELLRIKEAQEKLQRQQQQEEQVRIQQEIEQNKRKQAEQLRKKALKEEVERKAKEEEVKREEEKKRKMEEEKVRIAQMKAEARREEERKNELKRKEVEKKREEENKRRLEREKERQQKLKEEEMKRVRAEEKKELEEANKAQREYELQRAKEEAHRKKQQEQLKNIKLPTTSNWAQQHNQPSNQQPHKSVATIQKLEEEREREKREQEREQQLLFLQQQQQQHLNQQRGVWGSSPAVGAKNPASKSLMEIQQEEAQRQKVVVAQQPPPQAKPDIPLNAAGAWGNRPSTVWGQQPYQPPIWESPISNNQQFQARQPPKQNKRNKKGSTKEENNTVLALFKEEKASQGDEFASWCEEKITSIPTAEDLDVPTFVGFLREVESAYDVKDYVTSYLGDSKLARTFADEFLQQRSLLKQQLKEQQQLQKEQAKQLLQQKQTQKKQGKKPQQAVTGWNQDPAPEPSEVVTGSTKRGKRKQKKLQKVDPSILGFSVNAASDRVNMGQIETPEG